MSATRSLSRYPMPRSALEKLERIPLSIRTDLTDLGHPTGSAARPQALVALGRRHEDVGHRHGGMVRANLAHEISAVRGLATLEPGVFSSRARPARSRTESSARTTRTAKPLARRSAQSFSLFASSRFTWRRHVVLAESQRPAGCASLDTADPRSWRRPRPPDRGVRGQLASDPRSRPCGRDVGRRAGLSRAAGPAGRASRASR